MSDTDVAERLRKLGLPEYMVQRHLYRRLSKQQFEEGRAERVRRMANPPNDEEPPPRIKKPSPQAEPLSPTLREIARKAWPMLDAGKTRESIACKLGVSPLTLREALKAPRPVARVRLRK